jgi:hypothetical protein
MNRGMWFLLLLLCLFLTETVWSRPPDEAELNAASIIGERIGDWIEGLEEKPNSISIFSVITSEPLEQDYGSIVETETIKYLSRKHFDSVSSCSECRGNSLIVEGEKLIIRKGAPDKETLERIGAKQQVESFLTIDIYRTGISVMAQAALYKNPGGNVISAEKIRVPAVTMSQASVQLLTTLGIGPVIGEVASATSSTFKISPNITLLEELGFGKGGVNIGGVLGATSGILLYLNPTLAFRGRFGLSAVGWSLSMAAGFGLLGTQTGITTRGAFDIYLGSFTVLGFEGVYFIPQAPVVGSLQGFFGVHLGFTIGR